MIFIRNNKLFSCIYLLAVVITIGMVYSLGFREAVSQIAIALERLKNFTFPIWEQHAFSQHGFLVFYSMENYANKIAYFNHATAYLFCISFHFQQIAQAKCQGCYYPAAWDASTKHP